MTQTTTLKFRFSLLILLIIFSISIATAQSQPVFRIGVLDDNFGSLANGAGLAVNEINMAGGVRGADGTMFRLELVIQSPNNMQISTANLSQASVIAVIGPQDADALIDNLERLQNLNVPILTPITDDSIINRDATGRIFRIRTQDIIQGRALADYLVNEIGLRTISTVQLDLNSTAPAVGFTTSLATLGIQTEQSLLLDDDTDIDGVVQTILNTNPGAIVVFGDPEGANRLYRRLRNRGWLGIFSYEQADEPAFYNNLPPGLIENIVFYASWSYTAKDEASQSFMSAFARSFHELPGDIEAAGYDAILLLAEAIGRPGSLLANLRQIEEIEGIQGPLTPNELIPGEINDNVLITEITQFGIDPIVVRYKNNRIQEEKDIVIQVPTITPFPTLTPRPTQPPTATFIPPTPTVDGVLVTVRSNFQNVRTGPGLEYDIIDQVRSGEQYRVIGANIDFSWVVINLRGRQGWLAAFLVDIAGNRSSIPYIPPPPTPTPLPPTATPTPQPFADIIITDATPTNLQVGVPFTVTVTVKNQGVLPSGPFAIASTFQPNESYSGVNVPNLNAGELTVVNLTGILNGATGTYEIIIVADLNQQVNEGIQGEENNDDFVFVYRLDQPVINQGTLSFNPGGAMTLEGTGPVDIQWNAVGNALEALNGAGMILLEGIRDLDEVSFNSIDPNLATNTVLNVSLLPDAHIGVITAEGNRAAIYIENVVAGGPLTLRYRTYQQ